MANGMLSLATDASQLVFVEPQFRPCITIIHQIQYSRAVAVGAQSVVRAKVDGFLHGGMEIVVVPKARPETRDLNRVSLPSSGSQRII